jgi:dUTP pyrophosphatase
VNVNFTKLNENAKPPFRATDGSAGADLCACLESDVLLKSGERYLVPTGIAVEIPGGYGGFIFPRSSLSGKYGVTLANCVGVIDADYRGEVKVSLINHSDTDYTVSNGDRIAQLVIISAGAAEFTEKPQLSDTQRGVGGFGSTGK